MRKMTTGDIQGVSLEILKHVDHFCRERNIRYWLSDGSMLGAIRHKGFIPWDDDLDISMPRPDYERFLVEFVDSDEFKLYAAQRGNCFLTYARVCEMRRTHFAPCTPWTQKSERPGVGIDVLPLNGAPDTMDEYLRDFYKVSSELQDRLLDIRRLLMPPSFRHTPFGFIKDIAHGLARYAKRPFFNRLMNATMQAQIAVQRRCDYDKAKFVYSLMIFNRRPQLWKKEWFSSVVDVPFCDGVFPVPVGYDHYLRSVYGDYMTPPPESARGGHENWNELFWL